MTKLIDPRDSLTSQLLYQVHYGSYNWERAEYLMLRSVKEIKKLEKKRKKLVKLSDKDLDTIVDNAISIVDAILLTEERLKELNK